MYGSLGTRSMVYQNEGGGLQFLPLWSASVDGPYKPQWIDELGNFRLFDNDLFGDYIPITGSDQVQGSITPQQNNTIDLGQPDYRYAHIYATYVTSSNYYGDNIISTNITSSYITSSQIIAYNSNLTNVYSSNISSSLLTASNAQINNLYSNVITSSVINSVLYDTSSTAQYGGFAYFDETTQQLVSGGDLYDLPGWDIESSSIDARFKNHTHYITQSIMVGQTPSGTTDSTEMFLRGNNGNDSKPEWSYITPNYIKSNSDLSALTGPGVLAIDNSTGYYSGSWVTSSLSTTDTKILGVKANENTVSFFTFNDTLGIVTVPHGGTSRNNLTSHSVLIGNGTSAVNFVTPSNADSGQALVSNGVNADPSFGVVGVVGGGTGLTSIGQGQIIYGTGGNTYDTLSIGNVGQVLQVKSGNVPTWSNMYTLTVTGTSSSTIGAYNPTASNQTININPGNIGAAALIHSHSANDIVSGQLAIGRIPVGTSYDTVAAGNHVHENLNITVGTSSYTYNGGTEVNVDITNADLMSAIDVVPVQKGGTGLQTASVGAIFLGKGGNYTDMYSYTSSNSNDGYALISNGNNAYPTYQALGPNGGGTGIQHYVAGDIIYANGSDLLTTLPHGDQYDVLTIGPNNTPTWSNSVLSSSHAITTDTAITSSYAVYASNSFYSTYANASERLLTPFKISIHGAATAEAQYVDGQTDVQLNVYELDAHYLYGLAPIEVIPTGSYNTFTASTFKGNLVGTSSYASESISSSYAKLAPDYIPLAGTTSLIGTITPLTNVTTVDLGSSTNKFRDVYATNFKGTSSRVLNDLVITSSTGDSTNNNIYNGSEQKTWTINNGTIQVATPNNAITITQSNNDFSNHTLYINGLNNSSTTTTNVTISNNTLYKIGDKITIKAVTANTTYQYKVYTGSNNTVYDRKGQRNAITGSYGLDTIFTCIASSGNTRTWIMEKIPVTFVV